MRERFKDPGNKGSLTWRKMENYNTRKKWIKRKNGQILLTEIFRVDSTQVENNAKWGKGTKYSGKFSMLIGVVEAVIFVRTFVIVLSVVPRPTEPDQETYWEEVRVSWVAIPGLPFLGCTVLDVTCHTTLGCVTQKCLRICAVTRRNNIESCNKQYLLIIIICNIY